MGPQINYWRWWEQAGNDIKIGCEAEEEEVGLRRNIEAEGKSST